MPFYRNGVILVCVLQMSRDRVTLTSKFQLVRKILCDVSQALIVFSKLTTSMMEIYHEYAVIENLLTSNTQLFWLGFGSLYTHRHTYTAMKLSIGLYIVS